TFQNAGNSLSIGIFFSLMIAGLAATLPKALSAGLSAHHVPAAAVQAAAQIPPVGNLFAAFLGYNPISSLLSQLHVTNAVPPSDLATLTGETFFPQLISDPFHSGLVIVFVAAAIMSVIGAIASLVMGGKYVHVDTAAVPAQSAKVSTSSVPVTASGSSVDEHPADTLSDV
ncbi:MAG TPA: hypothetical protein VGM38_08815, partial [Pseudolysinimonas sp.]